MAQTIQPTILPAPSLNNNTGNGLVENRNVEVEGNDIQAGAISGSSVVLHTDPIVKPPTFDGAPGPSKILRTDTLDINGVESNPLISVTVQANFENIDGTGAGPNPDEKQIRMFLTWSALSDGGQIANGNSIVNLVYDFDSGIYNAYTQVVNINLLDFFPSNKVETLTVNLMYADTEVGFTNTNASFEYIGTRI